MCERSPAGRSYDPEYDTPGLNSVVKTWNISPPAQRRINNIHKIKRKKSVLTKLVFQILFGDFILKYQSVLENLDKDIINQSSQKPPCCGFQSFVFF